MINKDELLQFAQELALAAFDKKGEKIKILDMEGISYLSDYFLIISANNKKQAQSISDELSDKGAELGLDQKHLEGYGEGEWILLDFGDIVCHVFTGEHREFYGLEQLWNDAKEIVFEGQ